MQVVLYLQAALAAEQVLEGAVVPPTSGIQVAKAVQLFLIPHDLYRLKEWARRSGEEGKKEKKEDLALLEACWSGMMLLQELMSDFKKNELLGT